MMIILSSMLLITMMLMTIMLTFTLLSKKKKMNKNKLSPFECGFNLMSKKRLPFSIHFFMIAILFLIFDIEIIIIIPMISSMKIMMTKYWIMTSMTISMILIVGLYYEWFKGVLKWSK